MTWWLFQSSRLASEKVEMTALEGSVDWLRVGKWQASADLTMSLDFQISHGEVEFRFQMVYPSIFPDAPPMVFTADRTRISSHQYGPDGELCLEYRPDNWQSSVTGADMVASCYRLISEEHPNTDTIVQARSAHIGSLGRDLRSKHFRFLITEADAKAVSSLQGRVPKPLFLRSRVVASSFITSISHIGDKDVPFWTSNLSLPKGDQDETGVVVRVPEWNAQRETDVAGLEALVEKENLSGLDQSLFKSDESIHLLIGDGSQWELFWIHGETEERKTLAYTTIKIPGNALRLPKEFEILADKNVGIVGCGSIGSKIGASLARAGIGNFLLIDEDIFFPGNVVRNELGLQFTGTHKSYALRDRILELNPGCNVKALRMSLGGQESAESMAGALEALGTCDLLIDATAEPVAFNLVASASTRHKKPMIWAEVFAGGIGGLVARARPGIDPVPVSAKNQIETWCADKGIAWIRSDAQDRYQASIGDGDPLIADDSEVTIIAAHATRFATDVLVRPDASIFPMSAYVIGFSSQWLFDQPFDTHPIDLKPEGTWGAILDKLEPNEVMQLIKDHLLPEAESDATTVTH